MRGLSSGSEFISGNGVYSLKYVALIPARHGSKGIPGKNIKEIYGKPLIAWSIEQALACEEIQEVYVSTDSLAIKDVAIQYGAKVPFLRPDAIACDTASTESVVLHFIEWCEENSIAPENIVLMQCTSPIRHSDSLSKAIRQFEEEKADSLVTVTETHKFLWKTPGNPTASYDIFNRPRRQDIKSEDRLFFENGSFYITKLGVYKNHQNRLGGKISMFEMFLEESFEIDDPLDISINELMFSEMKKNK